MYRGDCATGYDRHSSLGSNLFKLGLVLLGVIGQVYRVQYWKVFWNWNTFFVASSLLVPTYHLRLRSRTKDRGKVVLLLWRTCVVDVDSSCAQLSYR